MNNLEITKLLLIVSGAFQNFQTNETTLETWKATLFDCAFEQAQKAVFQYVREGNAFAPQPGQIFQKVLEIRKTERRDQSLMELPPPQLSLEQIEKNKQMLADLSRDLAAKKALRQ